MCECRCVCSRWWLQKNEHFIALKCYLIHRMPNSWFKTECRVVMAAVAWVYRKHVVNLIVFSPFSIFFTSIHPVLFHFKSKIRSSVFQLKKEVYYSVRQYWSSSVSLNYIPTYRNEFGLLLVNKEYFVLILSISLKLCSKMRKIERDAKQLHQQLLLLKLKSTFGFVSHVNLYLFISSSSLLLYTFSHIHRWFILLL